MLETDGLSPCVEERGRSTKVVFGLKTMMILLRVQVHPSPPEEFRRTPSDVPIHQKNRLNTEWYR
jgi:hypothetical protein